MSREQLGMILQAGAQNPPPANGGPVEMRAWFEAINEATPIAEGSMISRVASGPAGGDLIRLENSVEGKLIIYYHGGGFLFGSSRSHRVVASNLARAARIPVLAADYRLAPEHPAPTSHDDAYAVYLWALEQGYAPSDIALCGDSAGGNLALATAVRARDEGKPLPAALMLMSPALDFAHDGESHQSLADAPLVNRELADLFNMIYIGDGDPRSPAITPLHADLSGLPPVLIHVGSWEMLRDDSVTVTERLKQAGVDATLEIFDGMCHSWQLFAPMLDEGMQSIEEAAKFLRDRLA